MEHAIETTGLDVEPAPAGAGPREGDVVVARQTGASDRFLLRQVPHPPVLSLPSRQRAIEVGTRYARAHAVDLWLTEGHIVTRLELRRDRVRVARED